MVLDVKFHTLCVLQSLHINIWHSLQALAQPFFLKIDVFLLMSGILTSSCDCKILSPQNQSLRMRESIGSQTSPYEQ